MTHVLVQVSGSERRYWRQTETPAGEWVERGLATRWPLAMQAHEQKARLLLAARNSQRSKVTGSGLSPEGVLRLRVVKLKAKAPVDLDALWREACLRNSPRFHTLAIELGSDNVFRAFVADFKSAIGGGRDPLDLLRTLAGQPTATTEKP